MRTMILRPRKGVVDVPVVVVVVALDFGRVAPLYSITLLDDGFVVRE